MSKSLLEVVAVAEAFENGGNVASAIAAYRNWLASNESENRFAAYFNLAVLYFKAECTGLAQAALRSCLRYHPGFEQALKICIEPSMDQRRPMAARTAYGHERIRVGWLAHASMFQSVPFVQLAIEITASTNEHTLLGWGSNIPAGISDVSHMTDEAVACKIRTLELDVLIDLMAWNTHGRPGIVAYHPAPLVASWTVNPQPFGLQAVDLLIVDATFRNPIPEIEFNEKVLHLDTTKHQAENIEAGLLPALEALLLRELNQLPARLLCLKPSKADLDYIKEPLQRGRRYVIVAPPYQHISAGIRVLYDLQKWLILAGFDAIVCTWFSGYPIESFVDDIVIYPEVAPGNILKTKRIVRYILNVPGKLGYGEKTYAQHELLVAYNNELAPFADGFVLQVPSTEPFFYPGDGPRDKDAMYVGKGRNLGLHPTSCVEITKNFPANRMQVADFLRSVDTFYTYDDFTILLHEAILCGCKVMLINPLGQTIPILSSRMPSSNEFRMQLHNFINITQKL